MKKHYLSALICMLTLLGMQSAHAQVTYVTTAPPLTGGNSQAGITFNVKAINAVTIREVWTTFASVASYSVLVWYHPTDSINGVPTPSTANGWVSLGPYTVNVTSTSGPVQIVSGLNIPFNAGTTHGFHIAATGGSVTYTTGPAAQMEFADANLGVHTGTNCGYGGSPPASGFYIRQFNGRIGYEVASASCNAPTGLVANGVTSSSAALSWAAVAGSQGYEYVLDQTSANPSGSGTLISTTNYNASPLTPNTTYYMHVRNKCGATTFSSWATVSFTTQSVGSCNSPAAASIIATSTSTGILSWSPVPASQGYEYVINQNGGNPAGNGIPASTTNAQLTGLTGGQSYYAHIRNVCSATNKSAWLHQAFTMPVCNTPTSLLISNITDSTTDLLWSQMPNASGYDYAADFSKLPPTVYNNTAGISAHLGGLLPNSKYYLHVRSRCFAADTSAWKLDSFVTQMACYAPIVQVNGRGSNTPYAFWDPIPMAVGYEFALTNTTTAPSFGNNIYTTFTGLSLPEDDKDYYLHVRTKCNSMFTFSQWSTVALRTGATGIRVPDNATGINVYPNPTKDKLFVNLQSDKAELLITDIAGAVILKQQAADNNIQELNTTALPAGVYLLRVVQDGQQQVIRFVKE